MAVGGQYKIDLVQAHRERSKIPKPCSRLKFFLLDYVEDGQMNQGGMEWQQQYLGQVLPTWLHAVSRTCLFQKEILGIKLIYYKQHYNTLSPVSVTIRSRARLRYFQNVGTFCHLSLLHLRSTDNCQDLGLIGL